MPKTQSNPNSVSLIFSLVQESAKEQSTQKNALETKASMLLAFAGGMLALMMGAREILVVLSLASRVFTLISIVLFAVSIIFALLTTWTRKYRTDPHPVGITSEDYLNADEEQTRLHVMANMVGVWKHNRELLERAAHFLRVSFISISAAFITFGIALFLSVIGG